VYIIIIYYFVTKYRVALQLWNFTYEMYHQTETDRQNGSSIVFTEFWRYPTVYRSSDWLSNITTNIEFCNFSKLYSVHIHYIATIIRCLLMVIETWSKTVWVYMEKPQTLHFFFFPNSNGKIVRRGSFLSEGSAPDWDGSSFYYRFTGHNIQALCCTRISATTLQFATYTEVPNPNMYGKVMVFSHQISIAQW